MTTQNPNTPLVSSSHAPFLMPTYGRFPMVLARGEGVRIWDSTGKDYLDFLAGIAVVSIGHGNKEVADAVYQQIATLGHVSNYFWTEPMAHLAARIHEIAGGWGRVFFANSGSEANETAIKLARKWGYPERYKIISAVQGFHGRTLGALAATGQPKKWKGFEPLPGGFEHAVYNDIASFESLIDSQTAAVLVEPIQGEGGIIPAHPDFLTQLRALCTEKKVLLILDEIQCGVGRTGEWWGYQSYGVQPDIFTTAKALGNGLPIGACIAAEAIADQFKPGDHGSTFGGNPMISSGALATLAYIERYNLRDNAKVQGGYLAQRLRALSHVKEVRGRGLMLGAELSAPVSQMVMQKCLDHGLILNAVTESTLRIVPPLIVTADEVDEAIGKLQRALSEVLG